MRLAVSNRWQRETGNRLGECSPQTYKVGDIGVMIVSHPDFLQNWPVLTPARSVQTDSVLL